MSCWATNDLTSSHHLSVLLTAVSHFQESILKMISQLFSELISFDSDIFSEGPLKEFTMFYLH